MDSFEWMELQTLAGDITHARLRLAQARAKQDHHEAAQLEKQIAAAEQRRARMLAQITDKLTTVPGAASEPEMAVEDAAVEDPDVEDPDVEDPDVEDPAVGDME